MTDREMPSALKRMRKARREAQPKRKKRSNAGQKRFDAQRAIEGM